MQFNAYLSQHGSIIMTDKKVLPPVYLFASISLMIVLHLLIPIEEVIVYPRLLFGSVPLILGIALNLIADRAFKTFNTTVKPFEESTALVTTGVFRVTRHPMYLGMTLILIGLALFMGSLAPFFVAPVFAVLMEQIFIKTEERMLEEKFGENWLNYRSKVRRWI